MQENPTDLAEACKRINKFFSDIDRMMQMIESQLVRSGKSDYSKHELYAEHPRGKYYISDYLSLLFKKNRSKRGTFQVLTRVHDGLYREGLERGWGKVNPFNQGEAEIALIMCDSPHNKREKSMLKYTGAEILRNSANLQTIEPIDDYYRGYLIWNGERINFIIKVEKLSSFSDGELDSLIDEKIINRVPDMEIMLKNYQLTSQ